MPLEMTTESDGSLVVRPIGRLAKEDFPQFAAEFDRQLQKQGKLRVLTDLSQFHGWNAGGLWEEFKFDVRHIASMERLAVVSDESWQRTLTTMAKPFLPAKTAFFHVSETAQARNWLAQP
jgi:tRNA G46 methylase TrmB